MHGATIEMLRTSLLPSSASCTMVAGDSSRWSSRNRNATLQYRDSNARRFIGIAPVHHHGVV